jgi:Uma2 family endonuclease
VTGGYTGGAVREPVFESIDGMTQGEFGVWVARREMGGDVAHYELLNGRVVMTPPAGYPHGAVDAQLTAIVVGHLAKTRQGRAFGSSQGFDLPSGDTVEPDLSVVSRARWLAAPPPRDGKFLRVVPDVTFEILSPTTRSRDRGEKKAIYERNGVREYWLVDTQAGRLTRFLLVEGRWDTGVTFELDEQASSEVLPGLVIDVAGLLTTEL